MSAQNSQESQKPIELCDLRQLPRGELSTIMQQLFPTGAWKSVLEQFVSSSGESSDLSKESLPVVNNQNEKASEKKTDPWWNRWAVASETEMTILIKQLLGKMMFGYGDTEEPQTESIEEMYKVLEEFRDCVMNEKVLKQVCGEKRPADKIASNRMMKVMKGVFRHWWQKFEVVMNIEKKIKVEQWSSNSEEMKSLSSLINSESSENSSDNLIERISFQKERSLQVDENTLESARTVNLLGKGQQSKQLMKAFISWRLKNGETWKMTSKFIKFWSYCAGKTVQLVIETIIKGRNNGKLMPVDSPLMPEEIKSNKISILQTIALKVEKQLVKTKSVNQLAFDLFSQEYIAFGYNKMLSNLLASRKKKFNSDITIQLGDIGPSQAWQGMKKGYQEMWIQRVVAEKLMKKSKMKENDPKQLTKISKQIPYYQFVINEVNKVENNDGIMFGDIFKRWFLHSNQVEQFETTPMPLKKIKQELSSQSHCESISSQSAQERPIIRKQMFGNNSKNGRLNSLFD